MRELWVHSSRRVLADTRCLRNRHGGLGHWRLQRCSCHSSCRGLAGRRFRRLRRRRRCVGLQRDACGCLRHGLRLWPRRRRCCGGARRVRTRRVGLRIGQLSGVPGCPSRCHLRNCLHRSLPCVLGRDPRAFQRRRNLIEEIHTRGPFGRGSGRLDRDGPLLSDLRRRGLCPRRRHARATLALCRARTPVRLGSLRSGANVRIRTRPPSSSRRGFCLGPSSRRDILRYTPLHASFVPPSGSWEAAGGQ